MYYDYYTQILNQLSNKQDYSLDFLKHQQLAYNSNQFYQFNSQDFSQELRTKTLASYVSKLILRMWHHNSPSLNHSSSQTALSFYGLCYQVLNSTYVPLPTVLLALQYVNLFVKYKPSCQGATGSEFRLLVTALILASKYLDDNTYHNSSWSEVTGFSVKEINVMELEFLSAINYRLYISHEDFYKWIFSTRCIMSTNEMELLIKYRYIPELCSPQPIINNHYNSIIYSLPQQPYYTPVSTPYPTQYDNNMIYSKVLMYNNNNNINNIYYYPSSETSSLPTISYKQDRKIKKKMNQYNSFYSNNLSAVV